MHRTDIFSSSGGLDLELESRCLCLVLELEQQQQSLTASLLFWLVIIIYDVGGDIEVYEIVQE